MEHGKGLHSSTSVWAFSASASCPVVGPQWHAQGRPPGLS